MKIKAKSLSLLLLCAIVVSGCTGQPAAEEKKAPEAPTPVQVTQVATGTVASSAGFTGKLAPSKTVQIAPKAGGKIQTLNAVLGQKVAAGTVLFTLDKTDLMNAVKQAEAGYQVALASLKSSGTNSNQAAQSAKNQLAQAEQTLANAQRDFQRMNSLFQQGAISSQQLEQSQLALKNAETAYANAQTNAAAAGEMTQIGVSEASVNQARVQLENARQQLANAVVTAPISGYISEVTGAVGEIASPQMPVVTIVVTNPLIVKANLSEAEITSVKVGTKTVIELPALAKEIQATVTAISPVMDNQLKAYPVEVSVPNPTNELKADMIANLKLSGNTQVTSLVVPRKAVFDENNKQYVYKVEGGVAKKVEVTVGEESSDMIEIKTGVAKGEQVVVRGQTLLKDGAKVEIQKSE
ncbi:efflux RND transporter periplasmic adaptor subunit [Brevibacillus dissolubilis]|uniref:efflux RND transporter periplasmic adaptor subunit n=1 Tax=Brevibacillus dissolubilis TaxID=1844116 RepID=UPI0011165B76|nr:efflux RND transporter periplasmic adaptor subunit [Brevibacillus dissolubilis]